MHIKFYVSTFWNSTWDLNDIHSKVQDVNWFDFNIEPYATSQLNIQRTNDKKKNTEKLIKDEKERRKIDWLNLRNFYRAHTSSTYIE